MIAVFWKEMRENWRWASLGFLAMAATLILMWRGSSLVFDGTPCTWIGMIAMFTAIALGILQTRRDKRPASRALLLHRGITADVAFVGKLLAGLALYSFAVFVPLLVMALFIAVNGIEHKAASVPALVPPALAALAAFGFWPATLLIVQRDARSLGSRLMPAMPAFLTVSISITTSDATNGWLVFSLISLLNLFVLLLAAWSVFANSGQVATGFGRAALAGTVSFGFVVVFLFVATIVESQRSAEPATVDRVFAAQMGPKGQPWLVRSEHSHQHDIDQPEQAAQMAVGRSVRDQLQPIAEGWKKTPDWSADGRGGGDGPGIWTRFTRIASAPVSGLPGIKRREWVLDHKCDEILVYHLNMPREWQLARRLPAPAPVESFGQVRSCGRMDAEDNFTLVTSTGAFYVSGDGSAIVTMYAALNSSTILGSAERHFHADVAPSPHATIARPGRTKKPFSMMLRLADRLVLLEQELEEPAASQARLIGEVGNLGSLYVTELQLPNELAAINEAGRIGSLYVTETQSLNIARDPEHDGAYLGLAQSGHPSERRILWARFDAGGQVAAQQEFNENTSPEYTNDAAPDSYGGEIVVFAMPPAVLALGAGVAVVAMDDLSIKSVWESIWEYAQEDPARAARAVLLYLLSGIVGVPVAIWAAHRRRLERRQTWIWIAWGFAMGPAGGLSILAVYPRIVRERCSSCQKPTRIDLDRCEHCDHPLDELPRIGIEILDRDTVAASKPAEAIGSC